MNSSFPNRLSFSYLKFTKYVTNIIAEPKYKYRHQEQVTVRNHNRSTALEILGGLNRFYGYPIAPSASIMAQNTVVLSAWRFSNSTMDHHVKQITYKYYDEAKMRTRQKCVATDTWRSLERWSKRKPTVEPPWAKQQTKTLRPKPTKIHSFMSGPSLRRPTHRRAIKEGSKVINCDWVKH